MPEGDDERTTPDADRQSKQSFDLEDRTARFGEDIITFVKTLPDTAITHRLIDQVIRSATSVGANYCEADDAQSKKEFRHKISICKKEARETKHWLRMIATAEPNFRDDMRPLWQEAKELHLIFAAIWRKGESK